MKHIVFAIAAMFSLTCGLTLGAAPALADAAYVGVARATVANPGLPEVTVQVSTERLFADEVAARAAAAELTAAAAERAREEAREIWGVTKDDRIAVSAEGVFAKPVEAAGKAEPLFFRGVVAQGYMFKVAGEQKLFWHSEVTAAFKAYDAAYQAAKALAPVCKKNAIAKIVAQFGVAESAIEMVSVTFDVDVTDRDDANYVPRFRGMVVHGFSFKVNGADKFVQKAGVTPVFDNYNDAMHAARALTEKNFKEGRAAIMAEYGLPQDAVHLLSVTQTVDLM